MSEKTNKKGILGRKPLAEGEKTIELGFKCPKSLVDRLDAALEVAKKKHPDANRSELIRAILEYRIDNAAVVYLVGKNKKR